MHTKLVVLISVQFSSFQSLSCVRLFATPWIAARQASLSIINSQSSLILRSVHLDLYSFLNWITFLQLSCKSSLYILKTNSFQLYDLQIFSPHSVGIFSFLQIVSFAAEKFLILKKFIYFSFVMCTFGACLSLCLTKGRGSLSCFLPRIL